MDVLNDDSLIEVVERSLFDIRIKNLKQGTALRMVLLKANRKTKRDLSVKRNYREIA